MTGRRAIVGLCMLCALLVSAFAAQSASAAPAGETAYTCVKDEVAGDKSGAHCLVSGGTGKYKHVPIAQDTTTTITGTNANTSEGTTAAQPSLLKATIAGTPLELTATGVGGEGSMENKVTGGVHRAEGTGTIVYTGVKVAKPEGKGCKVFEDNAEGKEGTEGTVKTNLLKASTKNQEMRLFFEPNEGTVFASFFITCTGEVPETLQGTWTVTGSVSCPTSGATTVCTEADTTSQNTLKTKGAKAGLDGALTIIGKHPAIGGDEYRPLVTTTFET